MSCYRKEGYLYGSASLKGVDTSLKNYPTPDQWQEAYRIFARAQAELQTLNPGFSIESINSEVEIHWFPNGKPSDV